MSQKKNLEKKNLFNSIWMKTVDEMDEWSFHWMNVSCLNVRREIYAFALGSNADFKISESFLALDFGFCCSRGLILWRDLSVCGIGLFSELSFLKCRRRIWSFWLLFSLLLLLLLLPPCVQESEDFGGVCFVSVSICVFAQMGCFQSCSLWSVEEESGDFVGWLLLFSLSSCVQESEDLGGVSVRLRIPFFWF
jgi:hypothetical protein